ncbi:MAG: cytochrome c oxidase subunit II [Granulosicoccaceae bacterium]
MKSTGLTKAIATAVGLASIGAVQAADEYGSSLNMTQGVTDISSEVYGLHMTIFYVCCVIGLAVFGVMFYSIFKHRKSKGAVAATFHHSTAVEIVWTAVPLIILISMAIPAAKTLIAMEDSSESEMTIKVTGFQWKWHYEYMGEDVAFYSQLNAEHNAARQLDSGVDVSQFKWYLKDVDNELVVPVGKKIRFLHTAADVIHAWWVPDLALKKDAIPGFINENWTYINEPGIYRGKCAELCGRDHGFMPIVVRAVTQEEFDVWLAEQKGETQVVAEAETDASTSGGGGEAAAPTEQSLDALMARGEEVYVQQCGACHQAKGQGIPPMFPAITGSAVVTGPIDAHVDMVLNGKPGTAMAGFKGRLKDEDLAAVITFQRNGLGNSVGDSIQASELAGK